LGDQTSAAVDVTNHAHSPRPRTLTTMGIVFAGGPDGKISVNRRDGGSGILSTDGSKRRRVTNPLGDKASWIINDIGE
jgi:hypothetical protein